MIQQLFRLKIALLVVLSIMLMVQPSLAAIETVAAQNDDVVWTAPGQEKARQRAQQIIPMVDKVKEEGPIRRSQRLHATELSIKDAKNTYFLLDSPFIKAQEDHYGPVRFNHGQHAAASGDCSICHHLRPADNSSYIGDSNHPETVRCSACHQQAFHPDYPERLGLKAAYHQSCTPCHQQQNKGPVTCSGCHLNKVPEHKQLVKLPEKPDALQVTAECLRCHEDEANDMLHTAHWQWRGPSGHTQDHSREIRHGKGTTALNNY
ncbi:MAG: hypothetical protein J7K75_09765 [Desulfuromonas sp.]|nr:hypothetical protein [Desulfuromonas sp.]